VEAGAKERKCGPQEKRLERCTFSEMSAPITRPTIAPAIKTAIVRLLGRALRRAQHALRRRHMKAALCTLLCSVILAAGLATGPHRRRIVTPELLLATAVPLPPFGCMRRRAGHI